MLIFIFITLLLGVVFWNLAPTKLVSANNGSVACGGDLNVPVHTGRRNTEEIIN